MQAIVHIGMSKTGSTALQSCLQRSEAYLATRGLRYPKNPPDCGFNNHRLLAAQFLPFERLPRHMTGRTGYTAANIGAKFEAFVEHVAAEVRAHRPEALILSSETLFRELPAAKHAAIRGAYRRLGAEPRFVAYLRRPSEHYLAVLLQVLTASAAPPPPAPARYRPALESYRAAFGAETVAARLYDRARLEGGDIVADFCARDLAAFGVDPAKLSPAERPNDTLTAEAIDLLARYRRAFHPGRDGVYSEDTSLLRAALAEAERGCGAPRPRLRPWVAAMIDDASGDALWVRDAFGVVFPGLDYDRLAAARPAPFPARAFALEDLVVLDRAAQARIRANLARSAWAAAPERGAWLDALGAPAPRAAPPGAARRAGASAGRR